MVRGEVVAGGVMGREVGGRRGGGGGYVCTFTEKSVSPLSDVLS